MDKKSKAIINILRKIKEEHPDSFVYAVPNLFTRKMRSFMLIREDLNFVKEIVTKLITFKAMQEVDDQLCFALWQSVIVTYGKSFIENKAGMSKMERAMLEENPDLLSLHDRIMDLRHAYIAHRDDTAHEQAVVFLKISKTEEVGDLTEYLIKSQKIVSPSGTELAGYLQLFDLLLIEAEKKIQKHTQKAHQGLLENLSPKEMNFLLINNMKDLDE